MTGTDTIPIDTLTEVGPTLNRWLGTFWNTICADRLLVRRLCDTYGLAESQLYQSYLDVMGIQSYQRIPVYQRHRWLAVTVNLADKNTGAATASRLGSGLVVGDQVRQDIAGQQLTVGGNWTAPGTAAYPLNPAIASALTITDNILNPSVIWVRGVDFDIQDQTLTLLRGHDVFKDGAFLVDGAGDTMRVTLWLSDAMLDTNYLNTYAGYILGTVLPSADFYAAIMRAIWDLRLYGSGRALVNAGIAAILDVPCILEQAEIVETLTGDAVITDKHVYEIKPGESLATDVTVGAQLVRGTLLTTTVSVLDPIANRDDITKQVDQLVLYPGMLRATNKSGLSVTNEKVPVLFTGYDKNANPCYTFKVYGAEADVKAFWADVHEYCEQHGLEQRDDLPGVSLPVLGKPGEQCGVVAPLEYCVYHYLGGNFTLVRVDGEKLSARGRQAFGYMSTLLKTLPQNEFVCILEALHPRPETVTIATGPDVSTVCTGLSVTDVAGSGGSVGLTLQYREIVAMELVPI